MRLYVINLARAKERRRRLERQLESLGLAAIFHNAVDTQDLTSEDYAQVDRQARRRMGLWPQADGSIANWMSQRRVMQEIVENGIDIAAIFEDDAGLSPDLPGVLRALEGRPCSFDVVKLNRRSTKRAFIPSAVLSTGHRLGRVRYHDYGNEGYVITRDAALHFLNNTRKMIWEIDQALPRFWENGLNIFYIDPPVVTHNEIGDSQIEPYRELSRTNQRAADGVPYRVFRRLLAGGKRAIHRHLEFRRLLRGEIGVTHRLPDSDSSDSTHVLMEGEVNEACPKGSK